MTTATAPVSISTQDVRDRLSMLELLQRDGVEMKRAGQYFVGLCPFHQEKTPSFTVNPNRRPGSAHCFGCGWDGSIFDYWMERICADFKTAKEALAAMVGLIGSTESRSTKKKVSVPTHQALQKKEKPRLPQLRQLREIEIAELAKLRGLSADGIKAAVRQQHVGFAPWPQWEDGTSETWFSRPDSACGVHSSFVITDNARRVASFRRLDGKPYDWSEDRQIKAWTKGSPSWPIGAAELGGWLSCLLVEGGPDLLAAYHFLCCDFRLKSGRSLGRPDFHPVCMLAASCAIADDALPFFRGKKVRIVIHNDEPKQQGVAVDGSPFYRVPSFEAAARWTEQLTTAGAVVETFSLAGIEAELQRSEDSGQQEEKKLIRVKDLNDLALCPPEVWREPEIRAAFYDWDF